MEITKESLGKRLSYLEGMRDQMLRNVGVCEGAIQDCQFWLQQLDAEAGANEPDLSQPPEAPKPKKGKFNGGN